MDRTITLKKTDCVFCQYTPEEVEKMLEIIRWEVFELVGLQSIQKEDKVETKTEVRFHVAGNKYVLRTILAWQEKIDELRAEVVKHCKENECPEWIQKAVPPESPPLPPHNAVDYSTTATSSTAQRITVDTAWFKAIGDENEQLKRDLSESRQAESLRVHLAQQLTAERDKAKAEIRRLEADLASAAEGYEGGIKSAFRERCLFLEKQLSRAIASRDFYRETAYQSRLDKDEVDAEVERLQAEAERLSWRVTRLLTELAEARKCTYAFPCRWQYGYLGNSGKPYCPHDEAYYDKEGDHANPRD